MAEPWGAMGALLFVMGLANALRPDLVWRHRRRWATKRVQERLSQADGSLTDEQQRLERVGGGVAAIVGAAVIVAALLH